MKTIINKYYLILFSFIFFSNLSTFSQNVDKLEIFNYIYIDVSNSSDKRAIVSKVVKILSDSDNPNYFLFVSNDDKPLISGTGDDYKETLMKIISIKSFQPNTFNEKKKILNELGQRLESPEKKNIYFHIFISENVLKTGKQHLVTDIVDMLGGGKENVEIISAD